jgi:hypothetical protein
MLISGSRAGRVRAKAAPAAAGFDAISGGWLIDSPRWAGDAE